MESVLFISVNYPSEEQNKLRKCVERALSIKYLPYQNYLQILKQQQKSIKWIVGPSNSDALKFSPICFN